MHILSDPVIILLALYTKELTRYRGVCVCVYVNNFYKGSFTSVLLYFLHSVPVSSTGQATVCFLNSKYFSGQKAKEAQV